MVVSPAVTPHWPARLYQPHGNTGRVVQGTPQCVTAGSTPRGLHCRSVLAVIARDFTDNDATGFDLCVVVNDLAHIAPSSVSSTDLAHVYAKYVLEHAPTTVRASSCRCVAPLGRSVAAFGPRCRLPTCLLRRVHRWWSDALTRALQLRRPSGP
jgi:hypothetical protein